MARWTLPLRVSDQLRGGEEAHVRLGHAEHQQPQRQHPQEVLPRSSGLFNHTPLSCPSVTRFGEISSFGQKFKNLWQYLKFYFTSILPK